MEEIILEESLYGIDGQEVLVALPPHCAQPSGRKQTGSFPGPLFYTENIVHDATPMARAESTAPLDGATADSRVWRWWGAWVSRYPRLRVVLELGRTCYRQKIQRQGRKRLAFALLVVIYVNTGRVNKELDVRETDVGPGSFRSRRRRPELSTARTQ